MWLEAILSTQDLERALEKLTPTRIALREDGDLYLGVPSSVSLVAGRGLRVVSDAKLRWAVLGLHVPITIESATVLLEPVVRRVAGRGDVLAFHLQLEALSVTAVPALLEGTVVERINTELAHRHAELVWDFSDMLSTHFALPEMLQPGRSIDLKAAWGEVRIAEDAIVLAISFHVKAEPLVTATPAALTLRVAPVPVKQAVRFPRVPLAVAVSTAALSVTAVGFAIGALLGRRRRHSANFLRALLA